MISTMINQTDSPRRKEADFFVGKEGSTLGAHDSKFDSYLGGWGNSRNKSSMWMLKALACTEIVPRELAIQEGFRRPPSYESPNSRSARKHVDVTVGIDVNCKQ